MEPTQPLTQQAYEHIRTEILAGRLSVGSRISEKQIADELGISRTPVGEAIRSLATEGWVEQRPRQGTVVRDFTRREVIELYELREALETFAVGKAATLITDSTLTLLERYCDEIRRLGNELAESGAGMLDDAALKRFLAADMAFHLLIVRTAGNQRILDLTKQSRTISRLFRIRRQRHSLQVVQHAYEFHRRIADALRQGDDRLARQAMAEHIQASRRETLDQLDHHQATLDPNTPMATDLPPDLIAELERIEGNDGEK